MASLDPPSQPHRTASPAPRTFSPTFLEKVVSALGVVEKSVTALGIPGLEAAVGGTLRVLQMTQVSSSESLVL